MGKVYSSGLMAAPTLAHSLIIILRDTVSTDGTTIAHTRVNGELTRWKVKDCSRGQMVAAMKANI